MTTRVLHGWRALAQGDRGAALALGNFDGVHLGHRAVIADAAKAAARLDAPLGAVSFEPHPRRWFQPESEPFRLTTVAQQARALDALGLERLHLLPFDREMAQLSDRAFADQVLSRGLGARHVAVGFDITFGAGRTGDPAALRAYGDEFGFSVSVTERVGGREAVKYSSSAVRQALKDGRPEDAAAILGRPFAIEGVVERGRQLGRTLGFPTANVALADYVRPAFGVYATRTRLPGGEMRPGVANIGRNPTVGEVDARLEVWLFDWSGDLYDQVIETQLIRFLRPEAHFPSVEVMVDQIRKDEAEARALLSETR